MKERFAHREAFPAEAVEAGTELVEEARAWRLAVSTVAVTLCLYTLGSAFYPLAPLLQRAIFVLLIISLVFLRDLGSARRAILLRSLDGLLFGASCAVFGYVIWKHAAIIAAPTPTPTTTLFGLVAVVLTLEACRRTLGTAVAVLVLFFVLYAFFGEHLPRSLGGYGGLSLQRIVGMIYLGTAGIFGIVTYTLFRYIFLFVMFGKLLEASGALSYIMGLARAGLERFRGGTAMVSVITSGMMGSVSGSSTANVMVTGSVTIPLMRESGFEREEAGATEAAASTGGQLLPPVMGAAAFLIVTVTGIPYVNVMKGAVLPAILFFLSMLVAVYTYARRRGISSVNSQAESVRSALWKSSGAIFFVGLTALIYLLTVGYSPTYAAIYAMGAMLVVNMLTRWRLSPRKVVGVMDQTSRTFVNIGVAGPSIGILVGVLLVTGLTGRLSALVLGLAGGNLYLLLALTMLACIILGIGLPTSVAYLLLAFTIAPALVDSGVDLLAAHLFIFFGGTVALITPPVALVSYAGATIAESDFWRTSVKAFRLALPAYLLPFVFVLNDGLLLEGGWQSIVFATATGALGVIFLVLGLIGPLRWRGEPLVRTLWIASALMLLHPSHLATALGVLLGALGTVIAGLGKRFSPRGMRDQ